MIDLFGKLAAYGLLASGVAIVIVFVWSLIGYANARDEWEEERVRHATKKGCIWSILSLLGCGALLFVAAVSAEEADNRKQEVAREQEKREDALRQQAKDKAEARRMGISIEQYKRGESREFSAHNACRREVVNMASWTASNNWGGGHSWHISGDVITIRGNDIKMTNGFGGERPVSYSCNYNIKTNIAVVTSVN